MGRASRAKRERKQQPGQPGIDLVVNAGLASATGSVKPEQPLETGTEEVS